MHILHQVLNQDIQRFDDIKSTAEDPHWGSESGPLYLIYVDENKENDMFLCEAYLNIIVMSEMRYCLPHKLKKTFTLIQSRNVFVLAALDIFDRNLFFYFLIVILV